MYTFKNKLRGNKTACWKSIHFSTCPLFTHNQTRQNARMDIRSFFGGVPGKKASKESEESTHEKAKSKTTTKKPRTIKAELPKNIPKPRTDFTFLDEVKGVHKDQPPHAGERTIPKGAPSCLEGLVITASGTMDSITRKELKELISSYGGRLTATLDNKTDLFICGVKDVGKSKYEKAKQLNVKIIDEDGLFFILRRSNGEDPNENSQTLIKKQEDSQERIDTQNVKVTESQKSQDSQKAKSSFSDNHSNLSSSEPSQQNIPITPVKEDPKFQLLTEKYRPTKFSELVGNKSGIQKLREFLRNFDRQEKKAVIIYGPPGIGKTTAAVICAKAAGFHVIEFNASDTRNKTMVEKVASDIFTNQTLFKYGNNQNSHLRSCIIFDEVDGMTGDKGGIKTLTDFVKKSKIPIICICNDRFNKKLSTLGRYAIDIQFSPPSTPEIAQRIDEICKMENIPMNRMRFITLTNKTAGDMRSSLNALQLWSSGVENMSEKDIAKCDPYDACVTLLKPQSNIEKKIESFFIDYDTIPSYMHMLCGMNKGDVKSWANAIDSMALGNEISNIIRSENAWDLLNALAITSAVIPAVYCPNAKRPPNPNYKPIPDEFIKSAKETKYRKFLADISMRCRRSCGVPATTFRSTISELIVMKIRYLLSNGREQEAMDILDGLEMTKDDLNNLHEVVDFGMNSFPEVSSSSTKKLNKLYIESHGNISKSGNNEEERADYYIKSKLSNRRMKKI